MKKPTGPGRIETSFTLPGAPVRGFVSLLFNFDVDDAALKSEHQAWLMDHAVPSLIGAPSTKLFLRGMASQIGDRDYNLQLSKRRVEAVNTFLVSQGIQPGQIVTTFTGEDFSTSIKSDDERERAVEAFFEASDSARFERDQPIARNDGFDDSLEPPTVVLRQQASRLIRLVGGAGAVVKCLNPQVAEVVDPFRSGVRPVVATSDNFLLRLLPGVPGETQVVALRAPQDPSEQAASGFVSKPRPNVGKIGTRISGVVAGVLRILSLASKGRTRQFSLREDGRERRCSAGWRSHRAVPVHAG